MNVFIVGSPLETAKALDKRRLNKQIIECNQIFNAMHGEKFWRNHPCTLQYMEHEDWLIYYTLCLENYKQGNVRRNIAGYYRKTALRPQEKWSTFPTVSAVHRRNDGIPFDVDNLTILFGKWRTESLKAYGNAIVPQVMYRIFEAIEAAEQYEE